jgi:uncharacterized phage protein (TIGR02218 family)
VLFRSAVVNRQQFTVVFDEAIKPAEPSVSIVPDGFYERGDLIFNSGAGEGVEAQILGNDGNGLTLWLPLFRTPLAGDRLTLVAGCNRKIGTCRDVYGNAENNRSFFMLPGQNRVFTLPEG